ncbi:MAG: class I SAM-dependent methyltransferase [Candidatus Omnitrophica bacterium]|nr:class I SAM-dependent methyltransferase [Candidatus Omnitrophota bacterium]
MSVGTNIDLSDCPYGETTGPCSFINRPTKYYFFLAGLVRLEGLIYILEIGTNHGGSIMSISKGLQKDDTSRSRLVTVDIINKNKEGFRRYPHIKRIEGNSLDEGVARRVVGSFDKGIDLLYIDSVHEYKHTRNNINIYAGKLNPRYVVLDDIRQCDGMRKLWSELKEEFKDNAFDASDVTIRKGAGFGVIRWVEHSKDMRRTVSNY